MNKSPSNSLPPSTNTPRHPIKILYEDDHYIVFDKPAGLLVIPTSKNEKRTLVNIVNQQYAAGEGTPKLHPCHRIDEDTSGAIIFAKGKSFQRMMMDLFKRRYVTKKYIALVHGRLPSEKGEFRNPVYKQFGRKRVFSSAITRYRVLSAKRQFSIVEVQPVTGRTNQIRIHFSQAGHPLLGERKFAFARDYALKFRRTALHAASVEWKHPVYHRTVSVQSDLPKDMSEFIKGT
ncbi:MAG TPA: RNA pseudouridine synthase [Candidatus Omnitrophota bacterium]|nr:RNA pseudouridine synthase [Candidatus Omnitrophota bacterium]